MEPTCLSPLRRRGVILPLILVVVALLSLSAYAFSKFMAAERRGADQSYRRKQARLVAESGVEFLRVTLMKEPAVVLELGGLYDNPTEFCGRMVTDGTIAMTGVVAGTDMGQLNEPDPMDIGRFSVISPRMDEYGVLSGNEIRYGLEDESCKVNLRWIMQVETTQPGTGRSILMRLPGMTEELADSLLDWMDEDTEPRELGAEDEYYAALDPPYYCRNGIPDSLDELLLVGGMTPKLLYGIDWNRNGLVDLGEPDESTLEEFEVTDGSLNLGLISYLTLDSREPMVTPDGLEKINVNMDDLEELRSLLEERFDDPTWIDYIISYRQRPATNSASAGQTLAGRGGGQATTQTGTKLNSLLDLVQSDTAAAAMALQSPFSNDPAEMNEYLPILYDNLMTSDTPVVGRININQAPRSVLELFIEQDDELTDLVALYGTQTDEANLLAAEVGMGTEAAFSGALASEIIDGIVAAREPDPNLIDQPEMNYPFWPYTHGIVEDLELMKKLEPYFCTQGAVFKANIVGRFDERSPVMRLEVWLDSAESGSAASSTEFSRPAKVIRIRELTELGPGYAAEMLGADRFSGQR